MPLPTIPSGNVASALGGEYEVANSCRFNSADSAYMHKTLGTATNEKKFTFSAWVKRGSLAGDQTIFNVGPDSSDEWQTGIRFRAPSDYDLHCTFDDRGTATQLITSPEYKDPAAWIHVVFAVDTTQSTAANRMKLYVNGVQQNDDNTYVNVYPSQDTDCDAMDSGNTIAVGRRTSSTNMYFDGYMAEVCFVDGTAYAASDFGEFDEDSPTIWKPKDVSSLSFGNNGFYLDFEDSSNLGNDANGGTDLTEVNLAAADQATDTPTNNFCTLNPLAAANNQPTFSQGNCQAVSGGAWYGNLGTFAVSAGKWYWEVKNTSTGGNFHGVIADYVDFDDATVYNEVGATSYSKDDGGEVHYGADTTTADYGSTDQNDILGIALNMDDKQISFYDNGSAIVSNFALDDASNLDFVIPFAFEWSATVQYNFGGCSAFALSSAAQDENGYGNFEYSPPSGYLALCTKNLGSDGG